MITTSTSLSQVAVADLRSKQPLEHPGPADHTFYFLLADEEEGASFNMVNIDEDTINDGTILYNMIQFINMVKIQAKMMR